MATYVAGDAALSAGYERQKNVPPKVTCTISGVGASGAALTTRMKQRAGVVGGG